MPLRRARPDADAGRRLGDGTTSARATPLGAWLSTRTKPAPMPRAPTGRPWPRTPARAFLRSVASRLARRASARHVGQRGRARADLGAVAWRDLGAHAPRVRGCVPPGALWRPWAKAQGTRMVGVAPPARPAPPAEVRELDAAGRAVARGCEARAEGHRCGRGHRLEGVSAHASPPLAKTPITGETRPCAHSREARSGGICVALWAIPPRSSEDAPFVELHERHSTDVLATSNGAPPAASGMTSSTVRSAAGWAGRP